MIPSNVKMAIERFTSKYPLLGGIVATWSIQEGGTQTVAIGFDGASLVLYVAPEFVKDLPLDQMVGIIHHEVRHVVYGHLLMRVEDFPDEDARVIAQEVTVNEGLPEPLPPTPILLKDFPQLSPNEGTVSRYKKLAKRSAGPGQTPPRAQAHSTEAASGGSNQTPAPASTPSAQGQSTDATSAQGFDDHSHWEEFRTDEQGVKDAIRSGMRQAVEQAQKAGAKVDEAVLNSIEKRYGSATEGMVSAVSSGSTGTVRWPVVLRRYVGNESAPRATYLRPSRRFPSLLGIVPGRLMVSDKPSILAAIDTSGSMSDQELDEISGELLRLRKTHKVTVAEFDVKIHRSYPLRGRIQEVQGRGGTDFRPVFEKKFLRKLAPDLILIFTDGFGPAPEVPPRQPVIWIFLPEHEPPVSWGRKVVMAKKIQ